MLNNIIWVKNKMHILLIISFISVAIISFFFVAHNSYAETTDWSIPGYDGDFKINEKANADEPKYEERIGIDDIVYNRVPLFDINVFSNTAGGKTIDSSSPVYFLRTIVANWFVLGMNLSLAVMIIIIIYTGIRMALSTLAEQKAEYKQMLFSFVKAIAKIFVLAAIMALIINISQYLVDKFAEAGPLDGSKQSGKNLYVTMVTRALGSFSFKAKIPAAILFFGLTLTFFKFCYKYTKRMLNVYLLMIVAPVLVAKDAYEGASGKQSKTFSAWLQEFTLNVALQPAHALIYTTLVYVALKTGIDDVMSFLVAVLIMNFMVSADKIFFKIFNMRFTKGPGSAGAADAVTEGLKLYAGVQAAKEGARLYGKTLKGTAEFAKRTTRVVGGTVSNISNKIASSETAGEKERKKKIDRADKKERKEEEKRAKEETPNLFEATLASLDASKQRRNKRKKEKASDKAYSQIQGMEQTAQGNGVAGHMPQTMRNYIMDAQNDRALKNIGKARSKPSDKTFLSQMHELRKLSKRNDETGRITRKLLKMKRERELKKFKYVAGAIAGTVGQGLALFGAPALVAADESDMALMGITATMGNTSTAIAKHYYYRRNAKDELLTQRSFEDTIESLKNANGDLGTLQATFDAIGHNREGRRDAYNQMSAYSELRLDQHSIRAMLNSYILKSGQKTFDANSLSDMIDKVLSDNGVSDLGVKTEAIKTALIAEMLHTQSASVNSRFADALDSVNEGESGTGNRFSDEQIIGLAKDAVRGEDIARLTDAQLVKLVDNALNQAKVEDSAGISKMAEKEILKMAQEQREKTFAEEMQKLISTEASYEQVKHEIDSKLEKLVESLTIESEADKQKYINMVLQQLDLSNTIKGENKIEITKKIEQEVDKAIKNNQDNRNKDRIIINASDVVDTFAEHEKKLVDAELDSKDNTGFLTKEVREAIEGIKSEVKHEKTKKRSIGTITDLDRRLRHMRDIQ